MGDEMDISSRQRPDRRRPQAADADPVRRRSIRRPPRSWRPTWRRHFEKKGVPSYSASTSIPTRWLSRCKKLTSLADIKGQKIRVTSPEQGEFIKRPLGGAALTLGAPEVPSALDRSVVDGVLTASSGGGNIWKDLLKFNYRLGINYFNSVVIVNKGTFRQVEAGGSSQSSQDFV